MTKINVVVLARNEETLPNVLDDLNQTIAQMPNFEVEVIVVDDHSTDATAKIARSYHPV